jgi:Transposase
MKKVSTAIAKQIRNFSQQKLTIGLDLGDRTSWYCMLDEAGSVLLEQRVRTTAKAMQEVFGSMPRSRIALETGMHSPWVSRTLSELGHEVIVAHARNVRLIGESRRKDDRLDAQTLPRLARIDPQFAVSGETSHCESAGGSDGDAGASWTGARQNSAGQHGTRTGQILRGAPAGVQRPQYES